MAAIDSENLAVASFIAGRGNKIGVHEGDPGKTDANRIGTLEGTTTWGSAVMGTGDLTGYATVPGSGVAFSIPAGKTVSHFSVRKSDGTFLRSYPLLSSITVNGSGVVSVTILPTIVHQG